MIFLILGLALIESLTLFTLVIILAQGEVKGARAPNKAGPSSGGPAFICLYVRSCCAL